MSKRLGEEAREGRAGAAVATFSLLPDNVRRDQPQAPPVVCLFRVDDQTYLKLPKRGSAGTDTEFRIHVGVKDKVVIAAVLIRHDSHVPTCAVWWNYWDPKTQSIIETLAAQDALETWYNANEDEIGEQPIRVYRYERNPLKQQLADLLKVVKELPPWSADAFEALKARTIDYFGPEAIAEKMWNADSKTLGRVSVDTGELRGPQP